MIFISEISKKFISITNNDILIIMNIIVLKNKSSELWSEHLLFQRNMFYKEKRSFSDISVNIRKSCIAARIRKSTVSLFRYVVGEGISPLKINAREKRGNRKFST